MSDQIVSLQTEFTGMVRDVSRDRLPDGAAWNMVDWIPNQLDAPLAKRGGYSYASENLTSVFAAADFVETVIYVPFEAGAQLVALPTDSALLSGELSQIVSTSSTTDRGICNIRVRQPAFHRGLLILPSQESAVNVDKYNGSSNVTDLGGSPPQAGYAAVYKDRTVLANSAAEPQRVWFSAAGDPETWDTTDAWLDISASVTALWPLRNAMLVLHDGGLDRIRGAVPPPGGDMSLDEQVFDAGAPDARALAGSGDFVCYASPAGAYMTDGSELVDLTEKGGIKSYWQDVVAANGPDAYIGGIYRDHYVVSIAGPGVSHYDTLVCHLPSRRWFRLANIDAACFGHRLQGREELYWGRLGAARVCSFSGLFDPSGTIKNDADGDAVTPVLETAFYKGRRGLKRWRNALISYDVRDAASDNPVLTLSYATEPEATSYTAVTDLAAAAYTLPETSRFTEARRKLNKQADGIALKLAQSNASSLTKLYEIAAEVRPQILEAAPVTARRWNEMADVLDDPILFNQRFGSQIQKWLTLNPPDLKVSAVDGAVSTLDEIEDGDVLVWDGERWTASSIATAASGLSSTNFRQSAWTTYTPVLAGGTTSPTLGTGSRSYGRWTRQVDRTIHVSIAVWFGSSGTNAGAGGYAISLPVTPSNEPRTVGGGHMLDSSGGDYEIVRTYTDGSASIALLTNGGVVSHAAPWAWGANDQINLDLTYEAVS